MRISDWSSDVCSSDLHLEEDLGVASAEDRFGKILAIAMAQLADRLEGEHDRRPELAPLGQQPREIVDARQIVQFVEQEPDAAIGGRHKPEQGARGAFEPAGEERLRRLEIILLARDEDLRPGPFPLVESGKDCAKRERRWAEHQTAIQSLIRHSYTG